MKTIVALSALLLLACGAPSPQPHRSLVEGALRPAAGDRLELPAGPERLAEVLRGRGLRDPGRRGGVERGDGRRGGARP